MADPGYANEAIQQFRQGTGPLTNPNVDLFGNLPMQQSPLSPLPITAEC